MRDIEVPQAYRAAHQELLRCHRLCRFGRYDEAVFHLNLAYKGLGFQGSLGETL